MLQWPTLIDCSKVRAYEALPPPSLTAATAPALPDRTDWPSQAAQQSVGCAQPQLGESASAQIHPTQAASHPYQSDDALNRLLLLIAAIAACPGIGGAAKTADAAGLTTVLERMQALATQQGIALPAYSTHTLRKDLRYLRRYGLLESGRYRGGYYWGTRPLGRTSYRCCWMHWR